VYKALRRHRARDFKFRGQTYEYFYHRYNFTFETERIVEVPILMRCIAEARGKRILEVGNVMSHYFDHRHDVIDKYERAPGVINVDVVDFRPKASYDLIVSCSTLEHVGWDEPAERDPEKIVRALENVTAMLSRGGQLVVTMPIGYNPYLDELLRRGRLRFTETNFLKRVSKDNRWEEVTFGDVKDAKYNEPFPFSNALVVGIVRA